MGTEVFLTVLSGTSGQAPRLCRAGLALFAAVRLGSLALGARTLWRDEEGDLHCDTASRGCLSACFDAAFPVSPFNLFLLQMASLLTHGTACSCVFRPPSFQGRSGWRRGPSHGKRRLQQLHWHSLLAKAALEGIFLVVFHGLYAHYPSQLHCPPSVSCPDGVLCTIEQANWKDAFNLFVAGASWASLALCLPGLYSAASETFHCASGRGKSQLERPLLMPDI
ncbi:gap junction beta-5 protein-like [Podarcis lilfordi]|uniref:Gap junction beta-5 protein-like n=1 Tax=Podarcis lilfordi TaxID=74358 RepID=A0AA35LNG9_9SAUR|nr:gap junction beta-5 protein-like [Podarcis lilfordi]